MNKLSKSAERLSVPCNPLKVLRNALIAVLLCPGTGALAVVCCARNAVQDTVQPKHGDSPPLKKEQAEADKSWYTDPPDVKARDAEITEVIGNNLKDLLDVPKDKLAPDQLYSKVFEHRGVKFHFEHSFSLTKTTFLVRIRAFGPPSKNQFKFLIEVPIPQTDDQPGEKI